MVADASLRSQYSNASCTGGGSAACNSSAPACCNVGSYSHNLRCYDPAAHHCCHYSGGPAGPPAGSLCTRSGTATECCVQMCYDPVASRCCQDQYGEGHTCGVSETCQINGCGPAPPADGTWCSLPNTTGPQMSVVIDSEASSLTVTTAAASCADLKYTYDASGEFPGQGALLLHSSTGTCLPSKMGPDWVDTLLVWSGNGQPVSMLNKIATLPPIWPLAPDAACSVLAETINIRQQP